MRHHQLRLIVATVATALVVTAPGVASAATAPVAAPPAQVSAPDVPDVPDVLPPATAAQVTATAAALDAQGVPSVAVPLIRTIRTTYTLPSGSTIVIDRPRTAPGTVTPQFSVGFGWGVYIYLNRTDQKALYMGGVAALGAAICLAAPAVGCIIASGAAAAAAVYIDERGGPCPSRMEIRIIAAITTVKCVR